MKVYVLEEFEDYEGTYIRGVVDSKEKAYNWTVEAFIKYHNEDPTTDSHSEKLPSGWKAHSHGFIYEEFEVT